MTDAQVFTTEEVADAQGIGPDDLLNSHLGCQDPGDLVWTIKDIDINRIDGDYEPRWYYEEEGEYMARLEAAIDGLPGTCEVPLPAFIQCGDSYDHCDGAHRLIIAIVRKQHRIRAYTARCTVHNKEQT